MKRLTAFLTMLIMLFTLIPTSVFALDSVTAEEFGLALELKVNANWQKYDKGLRVFVVERANYQILAPARPFAEAIGAEFSWNDEKQEMTFKRNDNVVTIALGSEVGYVNGEAVELIARAELVDDTSYVPVEFVGGNLNYHVIEYNFGRTIRLVQKTDLTAPYYDNQGIKPGMAELVSTYHRPVPTEFEKSNRLDDLYYYNDFEYIPEEELTMETALDMSKVPRGEVIYDMDDLTEGLETQITDWAGRWDVVEINDEGYDFDKALQIRCWYPPINTVSWICKPPKRLKEFVDPEEKFLVSFWAKTVTGGNPDTGRGKLFVHCEEDYIPSWYKSLDPTVEFGTEWTQFHFLMTGIRNANHFGFTAGFEIQTIQVAGFQVEKLADDADTSELERINDVPQLLTPQLSKDAPWRAEALDRIEKVRKGDFKVKVQDKNGNPVEGASVEFDMFEHEFFIGANINIEGVNEGVAGIAAQNMDVLANSGMYNAMGSGNSLKLGDFSANPMTAKRILNDGANVGIKYFRLHSTWMPVLTDGNGDKPWHLFGPDQAENIDWETFTSYVKEHINRLAMTVPEITEWEVSNEMTNRVTYDRFGRDTYLMEIYKWAREILPDHVLLTLCDNQSMNEKYWTTLDRFQENNIDYDVLGYQGHCGIAGTVNNVPFDAFEKGKEECNWWRPTNRLQIFDRFAYEYEKAFSITEFSNRSNDQGDDADMVRDQLIAFFSHPACRGVTSFWMTDRYSAKGGAKYAGGICFDENFELKLAGKVWADLFYNKWWTKDAVTVTDAEGKGQIRGFYGDYDLTVSVNGQVVQTLMAAYHRGYENELTITLDI